MATIKRFEDLDAWRNARELARRLYTCTNRGRFAGDFPLRDQIRRAGVSVMSNIAEGFDRGGTSEFVHFLAVARASCAEVQSHLYVALDQRYLTQTEFDALFELASSTRNLIAGLMRYLLRSGLKGHKFRPRTPDPER